ncbi:restriction endonuclease subunit S [Levilactobacillus zymae]|uniref:restriction endonuclease subunit S n=1 Tax=Levilactobacillus zymae TaxID=267363 RepID=UPI003FCDC533
MQSAYNKYKSKTGAPSQGDLLFTSGGKVGTTYLKTDESPLYVQGGAILYIKTSASKLLSGAYLQSYFLSSRMQKYIRVASTGLTLKHFTLTPAKKAPIVYPSYDEQSQIGSFFKMLDTTIASNQRHPFLLKIHPRPPP